MWAPGHRRARLTHATQLRNQQQQGAGLLKQHSASLLTCCSAKLGGDIGGPLGPPLGAALAPACAPPAAAAGGASAMFGPDVGKDRLPALSGTAIGADGREGMPPGALLIVG